MISRLISYFLIPILTLYLARDTNWFSTNFSSFCIALSRQLEFLIWTVLIGGYFLIMMKSLMRKRTAYQNVKMENTLLTGSAISMFFFLLAPYLPSRYPILSRVHVAGALLSSLLLFFCLLSLSLKSYLNFPDYYRGCLAGLIITAAFCISAFLLTGIINSAMEIFFVISSSLLARHLLLLEKRLQKSPKKPEAVKQPQPPAL